MAQVYPPPRKKRLLLSLLMQCLFMIGFVTQGFAQTAILPTYHGGTWQTGLPTGWTQTGLGLDKTANMGTSTSGGSANFDTAGDFIEITFDDVAAQTSFWIKAETSRTYKGLTFEVYEKAVGGEYTLTGQKVNPATTTTGEKVSFNLLTTTRTVKLVLTSASGGTATVDDVGVLKAVPKINIKQGTTDILSNSGSYNFGRIPVGSQSAAIAFTIENLGTADLLLTGTPVVAISGINASDFIVDFSTTATRIAPGGSTTFTVTFKPLDAGTKSATISISNNDAEINPYTFALAGESVYCPVINRLDIYEGKVGTFVYIIGSHLDKVTRVTFGGVDANFFIISGDTIDTSVPAGAVTGPIEVYTADCSAQSATFTVLYPTITVTAALTDFATQVGTPSASQSYTVSGAYMDGDIAIGAPAEFEVSLDNVTFTRTVSVPLPAGSTSIGATTIYVRYNPGTSGTHSGNIMHTSLNATGVALAVNGTSSDPTPLPVELVFFKAIVQGNKAQLTWVTASEKDNSHFEVQTSLNAAGNFEKLGRVDSKTTNSSIRTMYEFSHDLGNVSGIRYYRLKQVDLDGTSSYSKVVAVTVKEQGLSLQLMVAPNPLNYNSKIFITVDTSGKANVTLHDMTGKRVYQKTVEVKEGQTEVQLPLYDQLPNGLYILTVEVNGLHRQIKVVKQ